MSQEYQCERSVHDTRRCTFTPLPPYHLVPALVRDRTSLLVKLCRKSVVLLSVLGGLLLKGGKVTFLCLQLLDALLQRDNVFGTRGSLLDFGVFFLGMDEVEGDVECPCEDEGEEEGESCKVCIALGTIKKPDVRSTQIASARR